VRSGSRVIPIAAARPGGAQRVHTGIQPGIQPGLQAGLQPGGQQRLQPPLSLYIHIPWCVRKCPYCDFNSHAIDPQHALPELAYLAALRADLESTLPEVWGRTVHSIFIGGGTPSLLSGAAIERLLSDVRALLPLAPDCEITLEANPGTFEAGRYAQFRAAGVNRLSIGVQSFDDAKLLALGRVHDGAQALRAIEAAQRAFDNFNLDLMIGLPGQTAQDALRDVDLALQFAPPHLSMYQLTLEPNTVFHKYPPVLPDEDVLAAIQSGVEERVAGQGYEHYEVSAFCRPGRMSRHNHNYWTFGDYLGIGAGAHAKLCLPDSIVRTERFRLPGSYLESAARGQFIAGRRTLLAADLVFEFMLNALRLRGGFAPALFAERTGLPLASLDAGLRQAQARGLLEAGPERIRPTVLGMRFLNDLQAIFLDEKATSQ
jgi:oxygen-independent coproporphyrinogen-3 oxidase